MVWKAWLMGKGKKLLTAIPNLTKKRRKHHKFAFYAKGRLSGTEHWSCIIFGANLSGTDSIRRHQLANLAALTISGWFSARSGRLISRKRMLREIRPMKLIS
jgi:stress-induced morphogen